MTPRASGNLVAASRSPLIWALGVNAAMRHFGLRNEQVHEAREKFLLASGAKAVVAARQQQRLARLRIKVINAEKRYPGLTESLSSETLQAIGDRFNLSRQRVHVLASNLRSLCYSTDRPLDLLVQEVKLDARG